MKSYCISDVRKSIELLQTVLLQLLGMTAITATMVPGCHLMFGGFPYP